MITRNPESAQQEQYDFIIVGGGIYGAMLLLEAVRRNKKALLLEKGDFGSGTSNNSLRIIHGGLRYLQSLDLIRFHESVAERLWFLKTFPDLVKPMPCMMPLYNNGIKRPEILRIALALNDILSMKRNIGVQADRHISNGRILNKSETVSAFPGVITDGLTGSALWHDAHAPDTQRIIMELLHWATGLGASAVNYIEVRDILKSGNKVIGVHAFDSYSGNEFEYLGKYVINATGPASRFYANRWDRDIPELFKASIAWNILFDTPAPSDYALALTPERPNAHTYFLHPWKGRLFAGTGHTSVPGIDGAPHPEQNDIDRFIEDLNLVLPDSELSLDNVQHIFSGYLPVTTEGGTTLTKRAVIHNHGLNGGPDNLYSISGIKFTTCRKEAERLFDNITGSRFKKPYQRPDPVNRGDICHNYEWLPENGDTQWKSDLQTIIESESVLHLDDLIYRRTSIGDNTSRVNLLADPVSRLFNWEESRRIKELSRLRGAV